MSSRFQGAETQAGGNVLEVIYKARTSRTEGLDTLVNVISGSGKVERSQSALQKECLKVGTLQNRLRVG